MSQPSDVVFDPAAAYPGIPALRAALDRKDWVAARAVLDTVTPADRTALIRTCGDVRDLEDFLRYVLRGDPRDGAAAALLGFHLTYLGWEIRTAAWAKNVTEEQWAGFREHLRKAELVLIDACAYNPGDPAVWTARLLSARGLSLGIAEIRRRYDRLATAVPHHLPGQVEIGYSLEPKWYGSWDELRTFARDCALAAPPGTPHGLLAVEAFFAQFGAASDDAERQRLLHDPQLRAELYQIAQHSVLHPRFNREYGWVRAVSSYAAYFSMLRDQAAAARMFGLLGNLATADPWADTEEAALPKIRQARAWALGGAQ
ncbi:hypothetical protein [Actinoplanes sp. DH11]|uniref:hypothetical protein n=1 Tax=Actinoplanes sp. DH11 TaxID=2857011 RepID=UPI001E2AA6E0|nr:hypothetical protein [Actinoplanes sp. DH11]